MKEIEVIEWLVRTILDMIGGGDVDFEEFRGTLKEVNLDLDDYIVY